MAGSGDVRLSLASHLAAGALRLNQASRRFRLGW